MKMYDVVRYYLVPPLFVLLFTGLTQVLATWGNPHRSVSLLTQVLATWGNPHRSVTPSPAPPPPIHLRKSVNYLGSMLGPVSPPSPPHPQASPWLPIRKFHISLSRARICKHLRGPGIDSTPAFVALLADTKTPICRTGLPGYKYICWRNRFIETDSWAP
jgi:hypothetical protein